MAFVRPLAPRFHDGYFFFFFFFACAAVADVLTVDLADFLLKTLSQFFVNSGLGPERTIGPDIVCNSFRGRVVHENVFP